MTKNDRILFAVIFRYKTTVYKAAIKVMMQIKL